jgi:uncharacterized membrane protein YgcG
MLAIFTSISLSNEEASAVICVTALLIILRGIFSTVYPVRKVPTLLGIIIFSLLIFLGFAASGAGWLNWFHGLLGFYVFSSLLEVIYNYWFRSEILEEGNQEEQTQEQNQVALNPMVLNLVTVVGNEDDLNSGAGGASPSGSGGGVGGASAIGSGGGGASGSNGAEDQDTEGSDVDDPQPRSKRSAKRLKAVHPLKEPQPLELPNAPVRDSL